ncbi:MAG TPA: ADP-ribosylglycohydrolase family protein, partial [Devosia sp.]|nr:ADP-ribosylglycohydrolase family protein [Devosia sp.]
NVTVSADVQRLAGVSQLLTGRVQGTGRFYAAGFDGDEVVILKEDFGTTILASAPFPVEKGKSYEFAFTLEGDRLVFSVNGTVLLEATDAAYGYGMSGIRLASAGRISVGRIEIVETA